MPPSSPKLFWIYSTLALVILGLAWAGGRKLAERASAKVLDEWAYPGAKTIFQFSTNRLRVEIHEIPEPLESVVSQLNKRHGLAGPQSFVHRVKASRLPLLGLREVKARMPLHKSAGAELYFHSANSAVIAIQAGRCGSNRTELIVLQLRLTGKSDAARALRDPAPGSSETGSAIIPAMNLVAFQLRPPLDAASKRFAEDLGFKGGPGQMDGEHIRLAPDAGPPASIMVFGETGVLMAALGSRELETIHLARASDHWSHYVLTRLTAP